MLNGGRLYVCLYVDLSWACESNKQFGYIIFTWGTTTTTITPRRRDCFYFREKLLVAVKCSSGSARSRRIKETDRRRNVDPPRRRRRRSSPSQWESVKLELLVTLTSYPTTRTPRPYLPTNLPSTTTASTDNLLACLLDRCKSSKNVRTAAGLQEKEEKRNKGEEEESKKKALLLGIQGRTEDWQSVS